METSTTADYAYPINGTLREKLTYLLRFAVMAPSPENTQPWLFEVEENAVNVYADRRRALPVADPTGRELTISVGAVTDHLEVAMRAHRLTPSVRYLPDRHHPDLLVRITCVGEAEPLPEDLVLFDQIPRRHSPAELRTDSEVSPAVLSELTETSVKFGCGMRWIDHGPFQWSVASMIQEADEALYSGSKFREEYSQWLRTGKNLPPDGIHSHLLGLADVLGPLVPWIVRRFDVGHLAGEADFARAGAAPALGVLFTYGDTVDQWLNAGRALSHILLRAGQMGYQCALFDQPMDSDRFRSRLSALLTTDSMPQAVLRVGVGNGQANTLRRNPESFLLSPSKTTMV